MAKAKESGSTSRALNTIHIKRKGRHSKKKSSVSKNAKNYKKKNIGQGK